MSGGSAARVFVIDTGVAVTMSALTIRDGRVISFDNGGGVYNKGAFNLANCRLAHNSASNNGGGIYNHLGLLTVTNTSFAGNSAGYWGGGIDHVLWHGDDCGQHLQRQQRRLSGWRRLRRLLRMHTVANSTFSANSAGVSGWRLSHFEWRTYGHEQHLCQQSANTCGGVNNHSGTLTMRNTILTESLLGENCTGAVTNGGNNIENGATCGFGSAKRFTKQHRSAAWPAGRRQRSFTNLDCTWTHRCCPDRQPWVRRECCHFALQRQLVAADQC